MMIKKRGLSPVVATVLLIGIVIAIALIVFFWFKGITQEAITKFDGTNVKLVCDQVSFEAAYSGGQIQIKNTGNVPIYKMKAKISEAGSYTTIVVGENDTAWPQNGINQADAYSGSLPGVTVSSGDKILLIPVLIGNTESSGKKSYTCEDRQGKEIIAE